jgi:hypothetical protein
MVFPPHPEVLACDWLPPSLIDRSDELARAGRALGEPTPPGDLRPLLIEGPSGAGASVLARLLARRMGPLGPGPRAHLLAVRVRWCAGTTGIAGDLLRSFDPGFGERGFSLAEILAGLLRRIVRDGRPTVILLDDLAPGAPDVVPILRALRNPDRFLPEGMDRSVPLHLVIAASSSLAVSLDAAPRGRLLDEIEPGRRLRLTAYSSATLERIARDRLERLFGGPAPDGLAEEFAQRAATEGRGAARLLELMRARFHPGPSVAPPYEPARSRRRAPRLDARLRAAVEAVCADGPVDLSVVRAKAGELARAAGDRPPATTTFWRRLVRLEQAGLLIREIRSGGPGGSVASIRLPRAAAAAVSLPAGTLRACDPVGPGAWTGPGAPLAAAPGFPPAPGARARGAAPSRPAIPVAAARRPARPAPAT